MGGSLLLKQWGSLLLDLRGSLLQELRSRLLLELALRLEGSLLLGLGGGPMYFVLLELRSNVLLGWVVELVVIFLFLSSGFSFMLYLCMIAQNTGIRSCVVTTNTLHWSNITENLGDLRLQST